MFRLLGICCLATLLAGCLDRPVPVPQVIGCLPPDSPDLQSAREAVTAELAENEPFSFDFELIDVAGEPIRKSDFEGQVLIVDIWGTWCPPCRMEIPHFIALYEKYASHGLAVVGLNSERGSPDAQAQTVREFRQKEGVPYRCAIISDKVRNQITPFEGFPTTLFFDRRGQLRLKAVGYHDMATLQAAVEILLAEK